MRSSISYLDNIFFNSTDRPYTVVCNTYAFWNTGRKAILRYSNWNWELKRLRFRILYALVYGSWDRKYAVDAEVTRTAPPISPASTNIEINNLVLFDPSKVIGIFCKEWALSYILRLIAAPDAQVYSPSPQTTLTSLLVQKLKSTRLRRPVLLRKLG